MVGAVGGAWWWRAGHSASSERIVEEWDRVGGPWLRPNLRRSKVVIPDRPASHEQAVAEHDRQVGKLHRRRTFHETTNSRRLRSPEIGPKQGLRIIAIGDSITNGWGVENDETWPARLQEELRARGEEAEVINAGVPANAEKTMEAWCVTEGAELKPDIVIWGRRPLDHQNGGNQRYVDHARRCRDATRAKLAIILPPISTFDPFGLAEGPKEYEEIRRLVKGSVLVADLTETFRAAQAGKGEVLQLDGQRQKVVDQETGKVWIDANAPPRGLAQEIYDLFEAEPTVREHLFYDEGHPDAEGMKLYGKAVADLLEPLIHPRDPGATGSGAGDPPEVLAPSPAAQAPTPIPTSAPVVVGGPGKAAGR
jgi:hypothetical protein